MSQLHDTTFIFLSFSLVLASVSVVVVLENKDHSWIFHSTFSVTDARSMAWVPQGQSLTALKKNVETELVHRPAIVMVPTKANKKS